MNLVVVLILLSIMTLSDVFAFTEMVVNNKNNIQPLLKQTAIKTLNSFRNASVPRVATLDDNSNRNSGLTYDSLKNTNKFPLENAFKISVYRLNVNSSSPCNYTGKEKLMKCHQLFIFDTTLYQNAIKEAKNQILSRIGLRNEPSNVNMNRNTVRLLSGINRMQRSNGPDAVKHTQFDKQELQQGKTVKQIRELTDVTKCDALAQSKKRLTNSVCLNFLMNDDKTFTQKLYTKSYSSVFLWLNFNIKEVNSKKAAAARNQTVTITNLRQDSSIELKIKNGWNSVDISNLIKQNASFNETVFDTFVIKCGKDCIIDIEENSENTTNVKTVTTSKQLNSLVYLNYFEKQKPLLQINNEHSNNSPAGALNPANATRRVNKRNADQRSNKAILNTNSENESVIGGHSASSSSSSSSSSSDSESMNTNLCKNNIGHPNRECCLVSHYVSFNELKWSNWVMSPLGYRANYCIGRCTSSKDHTNSTYNGDFKQRYNQFFAAKFPNNSKNQLPTCCHPISTSSMKIKHLLRNGTIVTSVVPNMIITACGCS